MQNLLEGLNPAQQEAVLATEGPLLIVAGAGAGKTKTLTHRIGNLIAKGVYPEAILAIKFTNKAAKEMRERCFRLLGVEPRENRWGRARGVPYIGTFHGLGMYILREKGELIGIARSATILDQDDSLKLIKQAMAKAGIDPKQFEPRKIQSLISRHKGNMGTSENIEKITQNRYLAQVLGRVFGIYETSLREAQVLDFDDLLYWPALAMKHDAEPRRQFRPGELAREEQRLGHQLQHKIDMDSGRVTRLWRPRHAERWRSVDQPDHGVYSPASAPARA